MIKIVSVITFDSDPNALEIIFSNGFIKTIYDDNPEIIKALFESLKANGE